ncbi:MAG: VWA domain-containing protein [Candidatus Promineifilaceae bacterium]|nr:VWA domain-containing protein [Candidatus Promineifilaceae bacterium]
MSKETDNFLENILLFSRMLRQAGIPVSLEQSIDFARALTLVKIGDRDQVYHAARSLLVTRHEHLRLFETIFNRFWRAHPENGPVAGKKATNARRPSGQRRIDIATYMAARAREADQPVDIPDRSETYSPAERLRRREFSEMTPEELEKVKRLIREMQWQVSLRQTRRRIPDSRGSIIHLRRMMRSATKYGGVPLDLAWQSRKIKQRPFVLIADVSGSMEKYARLMLQFFYSVSHSLNRVECFVFGTRLTRITPALKLKNIDRAVDEAAREVVDWSGGTRIGESLRRFNREWSRRVVRRGAIVLVVSDGWERGDVDLLRREMRYLHHRCHRLIWLNPLLGKDTYQPRVEGMSAALPFVDDFLPVHNLQSLQALSEHLASLGKHRSPQPTTGT